MEISMDADARRKYYDECILFLISREPSGIFLFIKRTTSETDFPETVIRADHRRRWPSVILRGTLISWKIHDSTDDQHTNCWNKNLNPEWTSESVFVPVRFSWRTWSIFFSFFFFQMKFQSLSRQITCGFIWKTIISTWFSNDQLDSLFRI